MSDKDSDVASSVNGEVQPESKGHAIARTVEEWTPTVMDMATDNVRTRLIVPAVMLLMYYTLTVLVTGSSLENIAYPSKVSVTSSAPATTELGSQFTGLNSSETHRSIQGRIVDNEGIGLSGHTLRVEISDWKQFDTSNHQDCSKKYLDQEWGTVWWYTLRRMCTPWLINHTITSDNLGVANFSDMAVAYGPLAEYSYSIVLDNTSVAISSELTTGTQMSGTVNTEVRSTMPFNAFYGEPIRNTENGETEILLARQNSTAAQKQAVAFSWHEPDYHAWFEQWQAESDLGVETTQNMYTLTDPYLSPACDYGPQMAILENEISDFPRDVMTGNTGETQQLIPFINLTVVTSTSPCVFINFRCAC
jgi:hypothetical protein